MKNLITLFSALLLSSGLSAQTMYIFTGNGDGSSWNNAANWNPQSVPLMGSLTEARVSVQNGKEVVIASGDNLVFTKGHLSGSGTIVNHGTITIPSNDEYTKMTNALTFENHGNFNVGDGNYSEYHFSLDYSAKFNNKSSGVLTIHGKDIHYNQTPITAILTNEGTIKKKGNYENFKYIEYDGTPDAVISVEEGTLIFYHYNYQDGGIYNIAEGGEFIIYGTYPYMRGTFTGDVQGTFYLQDNVYINDYLVKNQLSGNGMTFHGYMQGYGTFENHTLFHVPDRKTMYLNSGITFENYGTFYLGDDGDTHSNYYVRIRDNAVFNNHGTFVFRGNKIWVGAPPNDGHFINKGTFKKINNFSATVTNTPFTNASGGVLTVEEGDLYFNYEFVNEPGAKVSGEKVKFANAANFTNNGIFNPGVDVGKMTVENFFGMENGILEFDLAGLTPETEYDVLEYTGNNTVELSGSIRVVPAYDVPVGDSFTVFRATNATIDADLGQFAYGSYNGYNYQFIIDVTSDEIKLTMDSKMLGTEEQLKAQLEIYPNPVKTTLNLKNDSPIKFAELIGMDGRVLLQKKMDANAGQLNLSGISPGVYLLKIQTGNRVIVKKVIKD